MTEGNDTTHRLLSRKWHVELDDTDISHTVSWIRLNPGEHATAELGIEIPVGTARDGLDPAHHRFMDHIGGNRRDVNISIKYGASVHFVGREAQVSDVRISQDITAFKITLRSASATLRRQSAAPPPKE